MLAWIWVPVLLTLVVMAALIDMEDGWPVLGTIIVGVLGSVSLGVIAWLRQRPIAPGDEAAYRTTAITKLALMEATGLIGFALAIAVGPWWLAVVGAGFSLTGLGLAWPSAADQERHELLYLV